MSGNTECSPKLLSGHSSGAALARWRRNTCRGFRCATTTGSEFCLFSACFCKLLLVSCSHTVSVSSGLIFMIRNQRASSVAGSIDQNCRVVTTRGFQWLPQLSTVVADRADICLQEAHLLEEAAKTVRLVLDTGAFHALPHASWRQWKKGIWVNAELVETSISVAVLACSGSVVSSTVIILV